MTTAISTIKELAPNLTKNVSDDTITAMMANAELIARADHFPETVSVGGSTLPILDMATQDMTLHLISSDSNSANGVTVEKVDTIERHYADKSNLTWLNSSPWGQAYMRLYGLYGGGQSQYAVVQH